MSNTNLYKNALEEKLKVITEELSALGIHNPTTDDWEAVPDKENIAEADQNSEADEMEDSDERQATLADLETEYRAIKKALTKIEEGTYGTCEICQAPIEEGRLKIKPDARTCVAHMDEETKLPL